VVLACSPSTGEAEAGGWRHSDTSAQEGKWEAVSRCRWLPGNRFVSFSFVWWPGIVEILVLGSFRCGKEKNDARRGQQ
jgi:hypothetical protein